MIEKTPSSDINFWDAMNRQSDALDLVPRSRRDPAVILYTSGSTGEPKGVQISGNFLAAVRPFMKYGGDVRPGDMFWPTGDPGWGWGFVCYHAALAMGVPVVSHEAPPTAELFVDLLERQQITNVATVPTTLRAVMAEGAEKLINRKLRLRCISSCGEPLNAEVVHFFQKTTGVTPCDQYGSSENGLPVGNFNGLDAPVKPGSMGNPMPGHDMAVVDEHHAVADEDAVFDHNSRADEAVTGYFAALADARLLLNFDERADASIVANLASIEIDEWREPDILAELDIVGDADICRKRGGELGTVHAKPPPARPAPSRRRS